MRMFGTLYMMCLQSVIFFVVLSVTASSKLLHREKRIINGNDVDPELFPWMASIQFETVPRYLFGETYKRYCGATLISDQWLLTAAHCFDDALDDDGNTINFNNLNLWRVRLKSENLEPSTGEAIVDWFHRIFNIRIKRQYQYVEKIIRYHKYRQGVLEYDIALMKLKVRIPFEGQPMSLPIGNEEESWPKQGQTCTIVGWGCKIADGPVSLVAQYAQLDVVEPGRCRSMYRRYINLTTSHEFCAGFYLKRTGLCQGDSGSGLVCSKGDHFFLTGVASSSHKRYPESYPGLFTRVSAFVPWIKDNLERN